jgi:hypothetical protein
MHLVSKAWKGGDDAFACFLTLSTSAWTNQVLLTHGCLRLLWHSWKQCDGHLLRGRFQTLKKLLLRLRGVTEPMLLYTEKIMTEGCQRHEFGS